MELTEQQEQDYIKQPEHCPLCGGEDLFKYGSYPEGDYICRTVDCVECKHTWTEVYILNYVTGLQKT